MTLIVKGMLKINFTYILKYGNRCMEIPRTLQIKPTGLKDLSLHVINREFMDIDLCKSNYNLHP